MDSDDARGGSASGARPLRPRWRILVPVLLVATLAVAAVVFIGSQRTAPPTLRLQHWDSRPTADGYVEQFRVMATPGGLDPATLTLRVDGAGVNATWAPEAGTLAPGATVSFPLPAHDGCRTLEVLQSGRVLVTQPFGSGAGTPSLDAPVTGCSQI